jgi:hypothetical protein
LAVVYVLVQVFWYFDPAVLQRVFASLYLGDVV